MFLTLYDVLRVANWLIRCLSASKWCLKGLKVVPQGPQSGASRASMRHKVIYKHARYDGDQ